MPPGRFTGIKFTPEQFQYIREVQEKEKLGGISQTVKRMVELDKARSKKRRRPRARNG